MNFIIQYTRYPAKADLAASLVAARSTLREIVHYAGEDASRHDRAYSNLS